MAELITLAAPVEAPKTVFRIALLAFDWQNTTITVHLREWNVAAVPPVLPFGERVIVAQYSGPDATALMVALNKANLSTQSLHQRVLAKLIADGKIPTATSSGAAD